MALTPASSAAWGGRPVGEITTADVAGVVAQLTADGIALESIRKSITAAAMVLDFAGIKENPARDRVQVRLPRKESDAMEPSLAEHLEAVGWMLPVRYMLALLVLGPTGARVGELCAATVGDLDEGRKAWLLRAAVAKTRRPRWVQLPDDLYAAVVAQLQPPTRTATRRPSCSPGSSQSTRAWRSFGLAAIPGCRRSPRTRSGTGASACGTFRASRGPKSASG